ncbi:atherin-like isoform X3 [Hyla sarda]|uniref:atherin-like isoform X3 n=1 Tax=Hyla sarda TaxID=327740 RepID=UPI0024C23C9D|nr:atherin-like isoform X3 [Hyla sarda]
MADEAVWNAIRERVLADPGALSQLLAGLGLPAAAVSSISRPAGPAVRGRRTARASRPPARLSPSPPRSSASRRGRFAARIASSAVVSAPGAAVAAARAVAPPLPGQVSQEAVGNSSAASRASLQVPAVSGISGQPALVSRPVLTPALPAVMGAGAPAPSHASSSAEEIPDTPIATARVPIRPQGAPVLPGDTQQPPVLGGSGVDPPYEDACDSLGPHPVDLPPLDASASSPLLFTDNMRQVSQPPRDRVFSRSEGRSRPRRSRSSSRGSGRSGWSRSVGSCRHHRRCSRRESRSSVRSRRSRSSRWRSPSSSGRSSYRSGSRERRSRRREGRRHHSRSPRRASRGGSRPRAVSDPATVPVADPAPVPATDPVPPPVVPAPTVSGFSEDVSGCCIGRAPLPPIGLGPAEQRLIPLVESSMAASTWAGHDVQRTMVYFLGHSYFHRAAQRADCRPGGRSLGCGNVEPHWRGIPAGLRRGELRSDGPRHFCPPGVRRLAIPLRLK